MIRADLARELAHDNTNGRDVLGISDDQIDDWFSARGINVIWTLDGLKAGTYGVGGSAITNQFFGLMGSSAPEPQWPGQSSDGSFMLAWLLYVEGSFQFLDGGRLDLGVVRDSVLDATNDYEVFVEPFESVAARGIEVYQVQSVVLPNGASAGTVATSRVPRMIENAPRRRAFRRSSRGFGSFPRGRLGSTYRAPGPSLSDTPRQEAAMDSADYDEEFERLTANLDDPSPGDFDRREMQRDPEARAFRLAQEKPYRYRVHCATRTTVHDRRDGLREIFYPDGTVHVFEPLL